ncbi:MAG: hypothetical protein WC107_05520 [Patescibacteria group bacterium]
MKKIGIKHLRFLTDEFGIWQHTKGKKIDKKMGYALDDSARALVFAALGGFKAEAKIYLQYVLKSVESDSNFFTPGRKPIKFPMSDDAMGQAYWASSLCLQSGIHSRLSEQVINKIHPKLSRIANIRGRNYVLLGSSKYDHDLTTVLVDYIKQEFYLHSTKNWKWPENRLTYGNAIIPLSVLAASEDLMDKELEEIGLSMLDFLNRRAKYQKIPIAIGNKGWYIKGGKKGLFDQQPIDPAYQVMANVKAYEISRERKYLEEAVVYFEWFWGKNIAGKSLVDQENESVRDGIMESGLSNNRGAENIACYLIAQQMLDKFVK